MSDLHEIGRAAADAAEQPDFESLRLRGQRRRTVRRTAWVGAAALAVVGVIGVAQLAGNDPASAPIAPGRTVTSPSSPTPSEEPSDVFVPETPQPDPKAARIVDDPLAVMTDLQVDPGNPDVMATLWQCTDIHCERFGAALALTGDGFETRTVYRVDGGGSFAALGAGAFHYKSSLGFGDIYRVPGVGAPSGGGGAVVGIGSGLHLWTLVEADGSGGPIANAEGFLDITRTGYFGLTALGRDGAGRWVVARSTDLGASWHRQRLDGSDPGARSSVIPSASGPALVEWGDNATLAPVVALWRLEPSNRWIRYAAPAGDRAYSSGQVVLPDGRVLIAVEEWGHGGPPGFYVTGPDDWSRLDMIPDSPFPADYRPTVLAVEASADSAVMVVADPETDNRDAGYRTLDGGDTWTPVRLR